MPSPVCCQYCFPRENNSEVQITAETVGDSEARKPTEAQPGARPRSTAVRSDRRIEWSDLARI